MKKLYNNVKYYRMNLKKNYFVYITQAKLAEMLGCSRMTVVFWETQTYNPTPEYHDLLCEILRIPKGKLLTKTPLLLK